MKTFYTIFFSAIATIIFITAPWTTLFALGAGLAVAADKVWLDGNVAKRCVAVCSKRSKKLLENNKSN